MTRRAVLVARVLAIVALIGAGIVLAYYGAVLVALLDPRRKPAGLAMVAAGIGCLYVATVLSGSRKRYRRVEALDDVERLDG